MFTEQEPVASVEETRCLIVGGGPAGVMLALLLARRGVPVMLLEAHKDFERDFRGDTVHPSTLDILEQLGLADRLHQLPHGKLRRLEVHTPGGVTTMADFTRLGVKYPYVLLLPQARFLEVLAEECKRHPDCKIVLGANVQRLIQKDGVVRGVRYRGADDQWHEVRALLTVAADGRFSKVRQLAGLEPIKTAPPMDVLWFRLSRRPTDPSGAGEISIGGGHMIVLLERAEEWQLGYVILKGTFAEVRQHGLDVVRAHIGKLVPWLADRAPLLTDWKQVQVLSVESSRLKRWYEPGLLLIGDAAHVMSPVGGVGINYAIQDAVEAANRLAEPLRTGHLHVHDLAAVQRRREWPVRVIQTVQGLIQKRIALAALQEGQQFRLPLLLRILLRLPFFRNLPARLFAYGVRPVRVEEAR
jgi:2-polyprenyl-6-methoxyphenol hydroxylase-like FAD-dependent oxidoreductase